MSHNDNPTEVVDFGYLSLLRDRLLNKETRALVNNKLEIFSSHGIDKWLSCDFICSLLTKKINCRICCQVWLIVTCILY